jgi:hypothetical protein
MSSKHQSLITLLPYQRRGWPIAARFKIGMFACQTGKTYATALEVVEDCLEAEAAGRRSRWVWLSSGERQAREAMEEAIKPSLPVLRRSLRSPRIYLGGPLQGWPITGTRSQ